MPAVPSPTLSLTKSLVAAAAARRPKQWADMNTGGIDVEHMCVSSGLRPQEEDNRTLVSITCRFSHPRWEECLVRSLRDGMGVVYMGSSGLKRRRMTGSFDRHLQCQLNTNLCDYMDEFKRAEEEDHRVGRGEQDDNSSSTDQVNHH
ncbi:hypothetical protein K474DRAFT_1698603 [Panus rudis PR-1116 ss-1]|nr:hypothetical protein K474DRAFT_1698603 [Panus rudis PR-1116 ss-1]